MSQIDEFINHTPKGVQAKRWMINVTEDDFRYLTEMAEEKNVPRVKIVKALIDFYEAQQEND